MAAAIAAAEKALGREGRVLVRASGTENKLRVLVEGPDRKRIQAHADGIAAEIGACWADRVDCASCPHASESTSITWPRCARRGAPPTRTR